jgi:hypothetical protein
MTGEQRDGEGQVQPVDPGGLEHETRLRSLLRGEADQLSVAL